MLRLPSRAWLATTAGCVLVLISATCNPSGPAGTVVNVELDEFTVSVTPGSVTAGLINFRVRNVGNFEHEFLVIRTDLAADDLPTTQIGAYDENAEGTQVLDEVEGLGPGDSGSLLLNLEAGHYALICNMVVSGTVHYTNGMSADFTVDPEENP